MSHCERQDLTIQEPGQDLTIQEPGKDAKTLDHIANAAEISGEPDQQIEVRFSTGTTMQVAGIDKHAVIEAVRFKVRHHVHEEEIVIDGGDAIRLIVKEVFEDRQFHIGHDGQITEATDSPSISDQEDTQE